MDAILRVVRLNKSFIKYWWVYLIIAFLIGVIVLYYLNNHSTQKIYNVVSCTQNEYSCNFTWNHVCTDEMEDECCEEIRYCGGTVQSPYDCLDKYCTESGKYCMGEYNTLGMYTCGCQPISPVVGILSQ